MAKDPGALFEGWPTLLRGEHVVIYSHHPLPDPQDPSEQNIDVWIVDAHNRTFRAVLMTAANAEWLLNRPQNPHLLLGGFGEATLVLRKLTTEEIVGVFDRLAQRHELHEYADLLEDPEREKRLNALADAIGLPDPIRIALLESLDDRQPAATDTITTLAHTAEAPPEALIDSLHRLDQLVRCERDIDQPLRELRTHYDRFVAATTGLPPSEINRRLRLRRRSSAL